MPGAVETPVKRSARLHRFTVDEFHRLAEGGFLGRDHRWMELLDGEIFTLMPVGPKHQAAVDRLNHLLHRQLGGAAIVRAQGPLRLNRFSEPLPDIAVLRPREDFYASGHPGPEAVLLVVEVADSSLERDLGEKAQSYAAAGILEYWIVNLADEVVHVFRNPVAGAYTEELRVEAAGKLEGLGLPNLRFTARELLG